MKDAGAIRHKVKQVRYRHLKKILHGDLKRCASNCRFNRKMVLPSGEEVGTCGFRWPDEEAWPGVCDESYHDYAEDFPNEEGGCPKFAPRQEKSEIKKAFREWLANATLPEVAARYPDLAALLWVLEDDAPNRDAPAEDEDFQSEACRVEVAGVTLWVPSEADAQQVAQHVDGLVTAFVEMEGQLQELSARVVDLEDDLDEAESDLEDRNAELGVAQDYISKVEAENTTLKGDKATLMKDLEYAGGQIARLKGELEEARSIDKPRKPWWQRFFGGWR